MPSGLVASGTQLEGSDLRNGWARTRVVEEDQEDHHHSEGAPRGRQPDGFPVMCDAVDRRGQDVLREHLAGEQRADERADAP